ncbi:MAG: hypothetical protein GX321_08285 [Clostridiales bacterium]|nr:hypothetical protein [Clostridiales bacterium]
MTIYKCFPGGRFKALTFSYDDGTRSLVGGRDDIWYATNIEIVDYMKLLDNLKFTADGERVYNPSAAPAWLTVDGRVVKIEGGSLFDLI